MKVFINIIIIIIILVVVSSNGSVIQFNNTFISNCKVENVPCNLFDNSNYWINNQLPSEGDDILIDLSTITTSTISRQDQSESSSLIYLAIMGNTSNSYGSLTLIGGGGFSSSSSLSSSSSGNGNIINLVLSNNINLLLSKLNLSNSYLNLINNNNNEASINNSSSNNNNNNVKIIDKLILSNNSIFNITNGKLQIDGILNVDESSLLYFYNNSTLILNGESSFKSSPVFKNNSSLINSNDPSTSYFYLGVQSLSEGESVLSNCKIYNSSYFMGKVIVDGIIDIINNQSDNGGSSGNINNEMISLLLNNDLQVIQNDQNDQNSQININSGTVLALGGRINNKYSLDSSDNSYLKLNGGTLEIISNSNYIINNYTTRSTTSSINEQQYGSIYFIQTNLNLTNSVIGFNNSNINIGNMGSTLFIINSTLNQLYEDKNQISTNSIISASNVTCNSIQLQHTRLIIEEESTFSLLGGPATSYSNNNIDTSGNLIISNTNLRVPLINLVDGVESSFYLINSNIEGSINITKDNILYPYGKSTVTSDLSITNGGQLVFDNLNCKSLTINGGSLLIDSNSTLYFQDNGSSGGIGDGNLIYINDGNLTINGSLIVNIKWINKIKSDYSLKLFKLSKLSNVNGLFNSGVSIIFNSGITLTSKSTTSSTTNIENYKIKIESGYVYLEISTKKLPKWYIHALVIGILCVIGVVAGLIYAIAAVNNTIKYYSLKRKEKYQSLNLPLLNSNDKDTNSTTIKEQKENQDEENTPLKNSNNNNNNLNSNSIIIKNEDNNIV